MAKKVLKQKKRKKKWFSIHAPTLFGEQLLGESHLYESSQLKGRSIRANLSTLINDMRKQNIAITFKVIDVKDDKGHTDVVKMELVEGFVKRLVRRGRSKIDDSFLAKTKDDVVVRLKPLVMTTSTCVRSTASQIRLTVRNYIINRLKEQEFHQVVEDLLSMRFQKDIKEACMKIHPTRSVDMRAFILVQGNPNNKPTPQEPEEQERAAEPEPKKVVKKKKVAAVQKDDVSA